MKRQEFMPFEVPAKTINQHLSGRIQRQKIAVIGGGISGMSAAYMLSRDHQVTLFEAENRLGGHARTVVAGKNGDQPVDTGFIVFNYANYPQLAVLFDELNVPVIKSNMSFGASIDGGRLEYGLTSLDSLFAQRRNLANPRFLRMVRDIFHFNRNAAAVARDPGLGLQEFLDTLGTSNWFRDYYLLPLSGAIWSTPKERMMDFPAQALIRFFENHALLSTYGQHQWFTVSGGSVQYVRRLEDAMRKNGVDLRLGAPIRGVARQDGQVLISPQDGDTEHFDHVVLATHSDDSLALLQDVRSHEQAGLGAIAYQPNDIILHRDTRVMPRKRQTWSSWVYTEDRNPEQDRIDLTYWMNSLQPIPKDDPHFVTLNSKREIPQELIYDQVTLRHPVYDVAALAAQDDIAAFNGTDNTWFCGAWMGNGFHEDGLASATRVVERLNAMFRQSVAA